MKIMLTRRGMACVGWTLVAALSLEFALRLFVTQPLPEPYALYDAQKSKIYGWGAPAHKRIFLYHPDTGEAYPEFRLNSGGWRDVEHPTAKKPGEIRFLIIGSGVTEGKVPIEKLYTRRFEKLMRENGIPAEVISVGQEYWSTDQVLDYLRNEGLGFQPDYVIYEIGQKNWTENLYPNEIYLDKPNYIFWRKHTKYVLEEGKLQKVNVREQFPQIPPLDPEPRPRWADLWFYAKQSAVVYQAVQLKRRFSHPSRPTLTPDPLEPGLTVDLNFQNAMYPYGGTNAYIQNGWQLMEALLAEMKRVTEQRGAKFIAFTAIGDAGRREWEKKWGWFETDARGDFHTHEGKRFDYQFDRLLNDIRRICGEQRIPLISSHRKYDRFLRTSGIPNEEGNLNIAKDLFDFFHDAHSLEMGTQKS